MKAPDDPSHFVDSLNAVNRYESPVFHNWNVSASFAHPNAFDLKDRRLTNTYPPHLKEPKHEMMNINGGTVQSINNFNYPCI